MESGRYLVLLDASTQEEGEAPIDGMPDYQMIADIDKIIRRPAFATVPETPIASGQSDLLNLRKLGERLGRDLEYRGRGRLLHSQLDNGLGIGKDLLHQLR